MIVVMRNDNKELEQERTRQDLGRVHRALGPATATVLFNNQAHDLPAAVGATDKPIARIGGGGSKRSFQDDCYDNEYEVV